MTKRPFFVDGRPVPAGVDVVNQVETHRPMALDMENSRNEFVEWREIGPEARPDVPSTSVEPLSEVLDDTAGFISRFVAFPSPECVDAVTLWVVHSHAIEAFDSTPRLALLSPEKGSGKTRMLEVLDLLVPDPMHAANLSAAAIFRSISAKPRTVLLADEADTYLGLRVAKDHEELRGLVNAGHRRGAKAYRCVGEPTKMNVQEFPAFCPVALAGIGDLPDTIIDRSIVIRMRRRSQDEQVASFRLRKVTPEGEKLRERIAAWASYGLEALKDVEPEMPAGIVDRPADVWEPLIAIGDAASPEWAERSRRACVELQKVRQSADASLGIQLLGDIRSIFERLDEKSLDRVEHISTEDLVTRLCDLDESPWGDLRGRPIDARGIARRLRPYDIRPKQVRLDAETTRKGYDRGDFVDPWKRYLSLPQKSETNETDVTEQVTGSDPVSQGERVSDANETGSRGETESRPTTRDVAPVSDVSHLPQREAPDEVLTPDQVAAEFNGQKLYERDSTPAWERAKAQA